MSTINAMPSNAIAKTAIEAPGDVAGYGSNPIRPIQGRGTSVEYFENALSAAQQSDGSSVATQPAYLQGSFRTAQIGELNGLATSPQTSTKSVGETDGVRALQGANLDKAVVDSRNKETGDTILDGLSRVRGVFDNQELAINSITALPVASSNQLMALQLEVVKYSMLMDVTSKLTGKSTQTLDTLMKGQ